MVRGGALALAVASCGGATMPSSSLEPTPSTVTATYEVQSLDGHKISLVIVDSSGLVSGIEAGRPTSPTVRGRSTSAQATPDGLELPVEWSAPNCSDTTNLTVSARGAFVALSWRVRDGGDCDPTGIAYGAILRLTSPLGPRDVVITETDGDAASWGLNLLGSDGRRRPTLVVDRSRRVRGVVPLAPSPSDGSVRPNPRIDAAGERTVILSWNAESCDDTVELTLAPSVPNRPLSLDVQLTNSTGMPCGGPTHVQSVELTFAGPTRPSDITARVSLRR